MNSAIKYVAGILKLNSRLFLNTLSGVTEEQAKERISGHSNSFLWIATHTTWARYNIVSFLGKPVTNPYPGLFENFRPYNATDPYPTLEEIKEHWKKASDFLTEALDAVTAEQLAADSPFKSPIGDNTIGGAIAFLAQHESYDIGQLGFLKKYLTKEAMAYN